MRNLGSVTPWDGSDAASNTYLCVIRNDHSITASVQIWLGILTCVTKFWSLVMNAIFEVREVALMKMEGLRHIGLLDPKYDGKTILFGNVGNYPPGDTV